MFRIQKALILTGLLCFLLPLCGAAPARSEAESVTLPLLGDRLLVTLPEGAFVRGLAADGSLAPGQTLEMDVELTSGAEVMVLRVREMALLAGDNLVAEAHALENEGATPLYSLTPQQTVSGLPMVLVRPHDVALAPSIYLMGAVVQMPDGGLIALGIYLNETAMAANPAGYVQTSLSALASVQAGSRAPNLSPRAVELPEGLVLDVPASYLDYSHESAGVVGHCFVRMGQLGQPYASMALYPTLGGALRMVDLIDIPTLTKGGFSGDIRWQDTSKDGIYSCNATIFLDGGATKNHMRLYLYAEDAAELAALQQLMKTLRWP